MNQADALLTPLLEACNRRDYDGVFGVPAAQTSERPGS